MCCEDVIRAFLFLVSINSTLYACMYIVKQMVMLYLYKMFVYVHKVGKSLCLTVMYF